MSTHYLIDHKYLQDRENLIGEFGYLVILNPAPRTAHVTVTLYFYEREPVSFSMLVLAGHTVETNYAEWPVEPGTRFAVKVESTEPIRCQATVVWDNTASDHGANAQTRSPQGIRACEKSYMAIDRLATDWYVLDGHVVDAPDLFYFKQSEWAFLLNPGDRSAEVTISLQDDAATVHSVLVEARRFKEVGMDDLVGRNVRYCAHFRSSQPVAVQWLRAAWWNNGSELMYYWSLPAVSGPRSGRGRSAPSRGGLMSAKLQWGILSTAGINVALVPAIRNAGRSELAAIASRDRDRAQDYARRHEIPRSYGGYEALLADPKIDVVYISLPNTLHCEWAVKAAQAGKHVLCEKPLVTTLPELDHIEAAARENGVVIFEAFMSLHAPQNLKVKKLIASGELGRLHFIESWFTYYLPPEDKDNIRLNPDLAGGALWDIGVYPISLAIATAGAGAPTRVWATQVLGETGVNIAFSGQMVFADGMVAQMSCGLRAPFSYGARWVGTEGIVTIADPVIPGMKNRVDSGPDSEIRLTRRDGSEETIVVASANPWQAEVEKMEACVLDGAEPVVPLTLSRQILRATVALAESARTGNVAHV